MDSFSKKVYEVVKKIPAGKVSTYSQIAELAGSPKAARAVGTALHKNPAPIKIPCHRVVNRRGNLAKKFAFGGPQAQKRLLAKEGVSIVEGKVPLVKCALVKPASKYTN